MGVDWPTPPVIEEVYKGTKKAQELHRKDCTKHDACSTLSGKKEKERYRSRKVPAFWAGPM